MGRMLMLDAAMELAIEAMTVEDEADLVELLQLVCGRLGCDMFALTHHVDFLSAPDSGIRIHNYPEEWAHWFDERRLGMIDPVHRASQRTTATFLWKQASRYAPARAEDEKIRRRARRYGIRDGLTVPAHIPGDAHGSVSFAWRDGRPGLEHLPFAAMIGGFLFEAARQIAGPVPEGFRPRMTDHQRECLLWVARGKPDWMIARILGRSENTIAEHLRNARNRYDAPSRGVLLIRALWDGSITFGDIAHR